MSGVKPKDLEGVRVKDAETEGVFEIMRVIQGNVTPDAMLEVGTETGETAYIHYLEVNLNPRYERADEESPATADD